MLTRPRIGATLFASAWLFILAAAAYDSHFAWRFRDELPRWELNALARSLAGAAGLGVVIALKLSWLAGVFGLAVYCRRRHQQLAGWLTGAIGAAYALLALYYLIGQIPSGGAYGIPPERLADMRSTPSLIASVPVAPR